MDQDHIWLAERDFEGRVVFQKPFWDKEDAKEALASKQGGKSAEDFTWEPLNYPEDESVSAVEGLELNESLIVKKMNVE